MGLNLRVRSSTRRSKTRRRWEGCSRKMRMGVLARVMLAGFSGTALGRKATGRVVAMMETMVSG